MLSCGRGPQKFSPPSQPVTQLSLHREEAAGLGSHSLSAAERTGTVQSWPWSSASVNTLHVLPLSSVFPSERASAQSRLPSSS